MERDKLIDDFLKKCRLGKIERVKIPGDASFRRYERIFAEKKNYILMDAPPATEDVKPFIKVADILRNLDLSAPEIAFKDIKNGLLLLEDLGNKKFNTIFKEKLGREEGLYLKAIEVLLHIYKKRQKFDIPEYNKEKLLQEAMLFVEWYLPLFGDFNSEKIKDITEEYRELVLEVIGKLKFPNDVMVLRDYHADNLMLLEERTGIKNVGLLDFQDALMGNVTYDLVSLLEDARRDVHPQTQNKMIDYFIEKSELDRDDFLNDYHILGAQRNLKIIGIFSRLKVRDGKEVYIPLIPRVQEYLKQDLKHPAMKELKEFLETKCKI